MKIIAYGKTGIGMAIATAETALISGVKSVTIECAEEMAVTVISPATLTYCPVAECSECSAAPCPFERQPVDKVAAAQALYDEAAHNMKIAEDNLRAVNSHA